MVNTGILTSVVGLLISTIGTLLLFLHVTSLSNEAIQDMGSIAVGYLGIIILGVSVSLTGIALLLKTDVD
jgi:hypothetical protein